MTHLNFSVQNLKNNVVILESAIQDALIDFACQKTYTNQEI